jgi:hypothetical protein
VTSSSGSGIPFPRGIKNRILVVSGEFLFNKIRFYGKPYTRI